MSESQRTQQSIERIRKDFADRVNTVTNAWRAEVDDLKSQIATAATSNDDAVREDALKDVNDRLEALADELGTAGTDPANPLPADPIGGGDATGDTGAPPVNPDQPANPQ